MKKICNHIIGTHIDFQERLKSFVNHFFAYLIKKYDYYHTARHPTQRFSSYTCVQSECNSVTFF